MYLIMRRKDWAFWTRDGWGLLRDADIFTEGDRQRVTLPRGGSWVPQERLDAFQLASLISCINRDQLLDTDQLDRIYETTDLDPYDILERAEQIMEELETGHV